MPVNSPGPTSTATSPSSSSPMSAWAQTKSIAGVRISAWRRPRADLEQGDDALVAAEGDADLLGRRLDAEDQHGRSPHAGQLGRRRSHDARAQRWAHVGPTAVIVTSRASSVAVDEVEAHHEVLAERRLDDVAPLDEHDAVVLGELAEGQVGDLGELVEAVQVGVVQRRRRRCRSCARA